MGNFREYGKFKFAKFPDLGSVYIITRISDVAHCLRRPLFRHIFDRDTVTAQLYARTEVKPRNEELDKCHLATARIRVPTHCACAN